MADEIKYEVVGSGPGSITVRYSLGDAAIDLQLPWHAQGDLEEFIGRYTPRQQLMAAQVPAASLASLVGQSGVAKEPVQATMAPNPPAADASAEAPPTDQPTTPAA